MSPFTWLIDRLPVRRRLGVDPLSDKSEPGARFTPVPIHRLKVTGSLRTDILARRKQTPPFTIDRGRRLAVIIPFRDREQHLAVLLSRLQVTLADQGIDYRIYVIEQAPGKVFSRARMINIGAQVVGDTADYLCLHDVDMCPEFADYGCPSQPLRLIKRFSRTFRRTGESLGYYFSGAIAIRRDQFLAVNGFDNGFWGFGSEDEDFFLRCLLGGLVPHEDQLGVFSELDNPTAEQPYRTRRIRKGNKRLLIRQSYRRQIGRTGMSDLTYRLLDRREDGRIIRVVVEP